MIPFVDLTAQYREMEADINTALIRVAQSGSYVLGTEVAAFERAWADYIGVRYAVGVANGTDAIELALLAIGIGRGDEVVVPAMTFISTALAVIAVGAKPVFCDVLPDSLTMDPESLVRVITKRTRAIVPVHLYGNVVDMGAVKRLAKRIGVPLVEDAAQAHGSEYSGKKAGSLGDIGCFSFYPAKNLGAYGDGGCVVTDSARIAERIRILRNIGQKKKNVHIAIGCNSRLDEMQAAVLRAKLPFLDRWNRARRKLADAYRVGFAGLPVSVVEPPSGTKPNYHLFVIRTPRRDELAAYLMTKHIATGVHYPTPVHLQPAFAGLGYKKGALLVSEQAAREVLSLPMYPDMPIESVDVVVRAVRRFLKP